METIDRLGGARNLATIWASVSLIIVALTVVFRERVISGKPYRFVGLKGVWAAYGVCALSTLWVYQAVASARANGITDPYEPSVRVPGYFAFFAFLAGTLIMVALLPGITLKPPSAPGERPSGVIFGAAPPAPPAVPVEVFLCASNADAALRDELERHLRPLVDRGYLRLWHTGKLAGGGDVERETNDHIDRAGVVIALTTPDLLDSERVKAQIARARGRGATIVPVLARPFLWQLTELGPVQPLPPNGTPVESWDDHDAAWLEVARGVLGVVTSPRAGLPGAIAPG